MRQNSKVNLTCLWPLLRKIEPSLFPVSAKREGIILYLLPVAVLETVWVLEKVYKLQRKAIKELIEAILNTSEFRCEMGNVFRKAIKTYEEKNIKFADAVMGYWGLEKGFSVVYTYDEKDYKRIEGLEVKNPS